MSLHTTVAAAAGALRCVGVSKQGVELSVNDETFANERGAWTAARDEVRCWSRCLRWDYRAVCWTVLDVLGFKEYLVMFDLACFA